MHQSTFIKRAKVLSRVMSTNKDLDVTISGAQAYRVPGRINLPNGDFKDPEWVDMMLGWIDHEIGHEMHTLHDCFVSAANVSYFLKTLLNIIEDVRMEKAVSTEFPGAALRLNKLCRLAIKKELFKEPSVEMKPVSIITGLCLYFGRCHVLEQHCLKDYADKIESLARTTFGNEITNAVLSETLKVKQANSTDDALHIAKTILELLESSNESEDKPDNEDDNQPNPEKGEVENDASKKGYAPQSETDSSKKPEDSAINEAIKECLAAGEGDVLPDYHEAIKEMLSKEARGAQCNELSCDTELTLLVGSMEKNLIRPLIVSTAKSIEGKIYRVLNKVLFDMDVSLTIYRNTGRRIESRRLNGVQTGNFNIFKHTNEQQSPTAAISVLVDASSSMDSLIDDDSDTATTVMVAANAGSLAFTNALTRLGIKTNVTYFGLSDKYSGENALKIAKSFDDKTIDKAKFCPSPMSSTPTGEAMLYAIGELALRDEHKKIMIILTDGNPNSTELVVKAKSVAEKSNIKIVPIGLKRKSVKGFDKEEFVTAQTALDIPDALIEAVKRKLI